MVTVLQLNSQEIINCYTYIRKKKYIYNMYNNISNIIKAQNSV